MKMYIGELILIRNIHSTKQFKSTKTKEFQFFWNNTLIY